ncbi:hypothetical protein PYCCODRAFT_305006 [Trametes coccinea BRFM310]|uniref:Uncharacterized protein n=1 Tax=Trametes coccinea (strain BRFM310) TaxID=1353009 RepID=A0A1Y2INU9_TRAC3|nr:hypothetical protein PYCCODRAFT_305006 [Trametes coccinea BRFM310]
MTLKVRESVRGKERRTRRARSLRVVCVAGTGRSAPPVGEVGLISENKLCRAYACSRPWQEEFCPCPSPMSSAGRGAAAGDTHRNSQQQLIASLPFPALAPRLPPHRHLPATTPIPRIDAHNPSRATQIRCHRLLANMQRLHRLSLSVRDPSALSSSSRRFPSARITLVPALTDDIVVPGHRVG